MFSGKHGTFQYRTRDTNRGGFPQDTNAYNTLFGGRLLSLMDKAAGIVCAKFAHREFVTISIDTLEFKAPARQGDLIEVTAKIVFTSNRTACAKELQHGR